MKNIIDINIYDLQGNTYQINSIIMQGNDVMNIIIKKPNEEYITRRKARELTEQKQNERI